ncbi:MAG: hypothetical protein JWR88_899 [Pseudonocardia sp.]|nr:hypothetical protein [Pseudonocardia sp.]
MFAHTAPATTVRLALLQEGSCNLFGGGTARLAGSKGLLAHVHVVDGAPAACIELSSSEPPLLIDDDRPLVALSVLPDGCTEAEAATTWHTPRPCTAVRRLRPSASG